MHDTASRAPGEPLLSEAVAAFLQSGLSMTVASRDERHVPSIAKASGCVVSPDRHTLTVLLFAEAGEGVARDIALCGQVAAVFTRPSTHETVQVKGSDARSVPVTHRDIAAVRRNLDLFTVDTTPLGWGPEFVDALFWRDPAGLLAIRFTPDAVFAQTPGPRAGEAIARRA